MSEPIDVLGTLAAMLGRSPEKRYVRRGRPGELRFDGLGAGLFLRDLSGDRNDPVNYLLMCPACGAELGPLGRFRPNADGARSPRCLAPDPDGGTCDTIAIVGPDGSVVRTIRGADYDEFLKRRTEKEAQDRARARLEARTRLDRDGEDV